MQLIVLQLKNQKGGNYGPIHKLHLNLRNVSFQVNGCHFSTLNTNNKRNIQKVTQKAELSKTGGAEKVETTCTLLFSS